jgi:hypothetical protein
MDTNETADSNTSDTSAATESSTEDNTSYSLDDLMNIDATGIEEFQADNHTGMQPLSHWIKHVPPDVRKHLSNLRADYTRKTQELARERDNFRTEYEQSKSTLEAERAALYTGEVADRVRSLASDNTEYDMYDPNELAKHIERESARKLSEMLAPAQEKIALEQRRYELNKFKSENPDITKDEYRLPIAELLGSRPELRLEDAYFIVKAKVDSAKLTSERQAIADKRSTARETFNKTSTGRPVVMSKEVPPEIRKQGAWAIAMYHKQRLEGK